MFNDIYKDDCVLYKGTNHHASKGVFVGLVPDSSRKDSNIIIIIDKNRNVKRTDCIFYMGPHEKILTRILESNMYNTEREPEEHRSLEHILNLSDGGTNTLPNLALAHIKCNQLAGNLSVVEKVILRDQMRGAHGN